MNLQNIKVISFPKDEHLNINRRLRDKETQKSQDHLIAHYRSHFQEKIENLLTDDPELQENSIKYFNEFLDLQSDSSLVEEIIHIGIIPRIIELFMNSEYPLVIDQCLQTLVIISYESKLPLNDDFFKDFAEKCIFYFTYGDQLINEHLLRLLGNLCLDYPFFGDMLIDLGVFLETAHFNMIDIEDDKSFNDLLGWFATNTIIYDISEENSLKALDFARMLIDYPYNDTKYYGIKMIHILIKRKLNFVLTDEDFQRIDALSAGPGKIVNELIATIQDVESIDIVKRLLSSELMINLSVQIMHRGDEVAESVLQFFYNISDLYFPKIDDPIIISAIEQIAVGSFKSRIAALHYIKRICPKDQELTIGISLNGVLLAISRVLDGDAIELVGPGLEILILIGLTFERSSIDLSKVNGYDRIADHIKRLQEIEMPSEIQKNLQLLENYYYEIDDIEDQ